MRAGKGSFFFGRLKEALKKISAGLRLVRANEGHAFFQIALAGQEVQRCLDEGLRIQRDEVGLVLVDALVVSGIDRAGFLWIECEVGETLAGAHLSGAQDWAQDQVVRSTIVSIIRIGSHLGQLKARLENLL